MIKYLFILIFILVYILFGTELGYTNTSPIYTHFTYIFQHASVTHLIVNSISFIVVFTMLDKLTERKMFLPASFTIGVLVSFLAMYDIPTVGVSAVIYVMIGLYIGVTLFYKDIKITDTRKYLLRIVVITIGLTISMIRTNSNFYIHIYSLVFGFITILPLSYFHNRKIKTSDD